MPASACDPVCLDGRVRQTPTIEEVHVLADVTTPVLQTNDTSMHATFLMDSLRRQIADNLEADRANRRTAAINNYDQRPSNYDQRPFYTRLVATDVRLMRFAQPNQKPKAKPKPKAEGINHSVVTENSQESSDSSSETDY